MPVISTNLAANSAVRYLNINSTDQTASLSKLASGSRITQASDDAAGLAISTKISSDVTALTQAATNASHGVSVLQTADGGASNISDILQRMKSLASQAASGTVTDTERAYIDAEFSQLNEEIDGIATSTRYNGQSLLDGTSQFSNTGISVVVGSDASDTINVSLATLTTEGLSLYASTSAVLTGDSATSVTLAAGETATFDITVSDGTTPVTQTVTIGSASSSSTQTITLDDVASAINTAFSNTGITADVDTDGYLTLTSDATGAAATVSVGSFAGGGSASTLTSGDLTGGITGLSNSTAYDFSIDGVTVSVTSDASGVISLAALESAIDGTSGITVDASVVNNTLVLTNSANGSDEIAVLAGTSSNALSLSNLKMDSGSSPVSVAGVDDITADSLGFGTTTSATGSANGTLSVATQDGATAAISIIDGAIDTVSKARADIGAMESRFSFRTESINTTIENLEAANSAIVDTDVASESAKLASAKVKTQAAVAAAAQASQMPQDLLKLLQ